MEVRFYDTVDDALLKFAVIVARSGGKWVFCKHKQRDTWECPGGHREPGETILEAAERELQEETGAVDFSLEPLCVYSVTGKNRISESGEETFGMLFHGEITAFEALHSEMERIALLDELPTDWTYPEIQPHLVAEYLRRQD